ncbi:hypothetical protein D9M70_220250 [compost metagenome]
MGDVLVAVAADFGGARRLQVDDLAHPRIDGGNIQRAAGFDGNLVAGIAQALQQRDAVGLGQRLATGDADVARLVGGDALEDGVERHDLATAERVGGVAILTAQGAAGEAHEDRRQAGGTCFPLQRVENLGDSQGLMHISHGRDGETGHPPPLRERRFGAAILTKKPATGAGFLEPGFRNQGRRCRSRCASWAAELPGNWAMTCWRMVLALSVLPMRCSTSASLYRESGTLACCG